MTAAKPTIDECIARAERDVDLAAGWLAADKDDADARQNYQHCVAVRDFLRAHKRLTESVSEQILQNQLAEADRRAAGRPEPVGAQHRFRHPQKTMPDWSPWQPCAIEDQPAWTIDSVGYEVEYRNIYGPDLLAYADRVAAERDDYKRKWGEAIEEILEVGRQLAALQAKHDALVKDAARYRWLCDNANLSLGGLKAQPYIELDRWALMGTRDIDLDAAIDAAMSAVALDKGGK